MAVETTAAAAPGKSAGASTAPPRRARPPALDNTSMGLEEILRNVHLFLEIRRMLIEEGRFYLSKETIRLFEIREHDLFGTSGGGKRSRRRG